MTANVLQAHMHQPQIDESALIAMQQHMAQQAAFSQIPDVVKGVSGLLEVTNGVSYLVCSLSCTFTKL